MTGSNLSQRGSDAAASMAGMSRMGDAISNIYDPRTNPDGVVFLGLADNALVREELLEYLNSRPPHLVGPELSYPDRVCAQTSLLRALAHLYNSVPDGVDYSTFEAHRKPLLPVTEDHIIVSSGAAGVIDGLCFCIAGEGDGILISSPYYNGFDRDVMTRAGIKIVPVPLGLLAMTTDGSSFKHAGQPCFEGEDFLRHHEEAIVKAEREGITVRALLLCNPHNPSGAIIPRESVVDLCKFAAKHKLHLVSDEIYSRTIFETDLVPKPHEFYSVLSIDVLAEAGLDPSYVHVITSASKDFCINGFRLGVMISQHNSELILAMLEVSTINTSSSPAGALWRDWIYDDAFLKWFLAENRIRLKSMCDYTARFFVHHDLPFGPSNSGHFCLIDLSKYLEAATFHAEDSLLGRLIQHKIYIAPGKQYHTEHPGLFRFTFSQPPNIVRQGLLHLERALGLEAWIAEQPTPSWNGPPKDVLTASNEFRHRLHSGSSAQAAEQHAIGDPDTPEIAQISERPDPRSSRSQARPSVSTPNRPQDLVAQTDRVPQSSPSPAKCPRARRSHISHTLVLRATARLMNPDAPAQAPAQGAAAPGPAAAAPGPAAAAPAQGAAAPGPAAGAPAQQQVAQANADQDQQQPQDRQAPANQAPAAGPAADADRQPRREGEENNHANDPNLNDPDLNDVPEGEQHRHEGLDITPEQLAEAEVLIANRRAWIQELAPELDKKARKDLTELAHNVIFTSEHTARDAFEMSLANIQHRRQIHEALGRELNTSSDSIEPDPAPPAQKAPSPAAAHPKKRQASEEADRRAKKRQTSKGRSKKKGKSKSRPKDSSSDDESSTDSSSCSSSSQRSFSSDDSSDSEDSSDEENPKWVAGKMNSRVWGSLNIPDRVARKVDKGEYVDLWWFTPQSLKLKHEEKSRKHLTHCH
ncbi:hypothetical protein A4X06_0g6234 [Tilletia controversa]|uniref:Aminotransferase class I/classII large domain-containing protein n=1 Tax=Tilletia controversa TaxID=13291 RepID=A0A8X7MQI7_9BASI|nr:hypothetical protein A4X06_0g6234 [Tilletia controversa]